MDKNNENLPESFVSQYHSDEAPDSVRYLQAGIQISSWSARPLAHILR